MTYRPDIDGLRALAVLSVVLYHLKLGIIPGGFVGVDVFFVISGYLITAIVAAEIRQGGFSIVNFYERRCRRIFPALIAVTLATTAAAYFLLLPGTFKEFGQSLAALGLFSTNILFFTEHGYFDGPSELKPLLHTWSLSVEEQFYIFFPLILVGIFRLVRQATVALVALMFVLSLSACVYYSYRDAGMAFYMPHLRAWELLAGAFIALSTIRLRSNAISAAIGIAGVIALLGSFVLIDVSAVFPGWIATVPVIGTCLLIIAGSTGSDSNLVSRTLSLHPVTHIGKLSYSLYLIHWPVIVFAEYYLLRHLTIPESVIYLVVCVGLAQLSYWAIENPVRRKQIFSRSGIFYLTLSFLVFCIVAGAAMHIKNGFPSRFSDEVVDLTKVEKNPWRGRCLSLSAEDIANDSYCVVGNKSNVKYALIGDSHADALVPAIVENIDTESSGLAVFTMKGCRPFIGYEQVKISRVKDLPDVSGAIVSIPVSHRSRCGEFMSESYKKIEELGVKRLVIHARWALQYFGHQSNKPSVCYADSANPHCSIENNKTLFSKYLAGTIESLGATVRVLLVGPIPEHIVEVPDALGRSLLFEKQIPYDHEYTWRGDAVLGVIRDQVGTAEHIDIVNPYDTLCEKEVCRIEFQNRSLYNDSSHLSVSGSHMLVDELADYFDFGGKDEKR